MAMGDIMGRVAVELELTNNDDLKFVKAGALSADAVRRARVLGIVDTGATRLAQLPEVVVVGKRDFGSHYAAATQLPEVVVVAKRIAHMVAQDDGTQHPASPSINAGF